VNDSAVLATVLLFESVTATVVEKGDPAIVLGAHVIVAMFEATHPVGRPLQA
jgi:hypothetical protein